MFYDPNNGLGTLIQQSINMTGSVFLTMLLLSLIIMLLIFLVHLPLEFSLILILPLHFTIYAYTADWIPILGSILIILGIIIAKNLPNQF